MEVDWQTFKNPGHFRYTRVTTGTKLKKKISYFWELCLLNFCFCYIIFDLIKKETYNLDENVHLDEL
jgi:hypothetical protein